VRPSGGGVNAPLLVFGILLLIAGFVMIAVGDAINNDVEMQLESLFSGGSMNPGNTLMYGGIGVVAVGVILSIVSFVSGRPRQ
jgi:hypothetical protein